MTDETTTGARSQGPGGIRTPPGTLALRVHEVYSLLIIGKSTGDIVRYAAERVGEEKEQRKQWERRRKEAKDSGATFTDEPPDVVWTPLPSSRAIDRYVAKAKLLLAEQGRGLSKQAENILGLQWERINAVFVAAFEAGKYATCARVLEISADMFGLNEMIRFAPLLAPRDEEAESKPLPEVAMTLEGALKEMREMARRGHMRLVSGEK